jgi:hypothetical protein
MTPAPVPTAKQPLYVAFLDVKGAYDAVNHATLQNVLSQEFALPPDLFAAIVGMYCGLQYIVMHGDQVAGVVDVGRGVKQGCPLSPLLYVMYVAGLAAHLQQTCPAAGFVVPSGEHPCVQEEVRVQVITYADDQIVLDGGSGEQPELLVDFGEPSRDRFCEAVGEAAAWLADRDQPLEPDKSAAMVMGCIQQPTVPGCPPQPANPPNLWLGGVRVPEVELQKYLGLKYDQEASATTMAEDRAAVYAGVFFAVLRDMRATHEPVPHTLPITISLLRGRAEAAGTYGCGLWGVQLLPGYSVLSAGGGGGTRGLFKFYSLGDPLERRRCRLLRAHFELPWQVPDICLLHELGMQPFVHTYVLQGIKLYNSLIAAGPLYRALLAQQVQDARGRGVKNWFWHLKEVLRWLLPHDLWAAKFNALSPEAPIRYARVKKALRERYAKFVAAMAAVGVDCQEGTQRGVYFRRVASHTAGTLPKYMSVALSPAIVKDCMRFRLGAHGLRVQREQVPQPAYMHRYCARCQPNTVDTQEHCLFACGCPALEGARNNLFTALGVGSGPEKVGDLFAMYDGNMGHLRQVVRFVAYCRRHVMSLVVQGGEGAPPAAAEEEAGRGQEGEEMAAGDALAAPGGPEGPEPGGGEGPAGDDWELPATDEYEDGSELVEVVGPASPGLVDYALRPADQPGLWEGMFGPEEAEGLGIVQ